MCRKHSEFWKVKTFLLGMMVLVAYANGLIAQDSDLDQSDSLAATEQVDGRWPTGSIDSAGLDDKLLKIMSDFVRERPEGVDHLKSE